MRKPTYTEIYAYKNLFWLALGVFGFVPVLNNFILQLVRLSIQGDIAYGSLSDVIGVFQEALSLVSAYLGLGVLAVCLVYFGNNAKGVIYLAFGTHGITFFASLFTYFIYGGDNIGPAVFMLFTDALVNAVIYLLIYIVIITVGAKKDTFMNVPKFSFKAGFMKHPFTVAFLIAAGIFGGAQLLTVVYTMVGDFLDPSLGVPVNTADIMYWVLEYVTVVVNTLIGFAVMTFVAALTEKYLKSGRGRRLIKG